MTEVKGYRLEDLILKYLREELTEHEALALTIWKDASENNKKIFEELTNDEILTAELKVFKTIDREEGLRKLHKKIGVPGKIFEISKRKRFPPSPITSRRLWRAMAAAAFLGYVIWSLVFVINRDKGEDLPVAVTPTIQDIEPGREGAILTLADGRVIVLDNAADGKITENAKKSGGKISYEDADQTKVEYNTMSTPKGRQYSLVLADGTKVWLNAASSITYPTAFPGSDRKVEISGEAYFEVAHNAKKPFQVMVDGVVVEVLGTDFNINSYLDEGSIKTTLLEGSVRIYKDGNTALLKPGEQAVLRQVQDDSKRGSISIVKNVNVDEVMAWKNGYFSFEDVDIKTVMRQLSRWYDIDVSYEGNNTERFSGKIGRNLTLKELLEGLGQTRVHYRIEGNKKVVILP